MNELLASFIEDLKDQLYTYNEALIRIENDSINIEDINSLFRSVHTIKGNSGAMQFKNIAFVLHEFEDVLSEIRDNKRKLNKSIIEAASILYSYLEEIALLLDEEKDINELTINKEFYEKIDSKTLEVTKGHVKNKKTEKCEFENEKCFIELNQMLTDEVREVAIQNMKRGYKAFLLNIIFDKDIEMKWLRAYMIFEKIDQYAIYLSSNNKRPTKEEVISNQYIFEEDELKIFVLCNLDYTKLKKSIEKSVGIESISIDEVKIGNLDFDSAKLKSEIAKKEDLEIVDTNQPKIVKKEEMLRIPAPKVDYLIDMLSELLILHSQMEQNLKNVRIDESTGVTLTSMVRVVKSIQNLSMSLRLVEIKPIFHKLSRIIRETQKELGKNIELIFEGEDTELDRAISEKIYEPLMHIVRNAIAHGIEDEKTRIVKGKNKKGKLLVRAYPKKGNVYIEVKDDGKGLDEELIYKKALEKGIAKENVDYLKKDIWNFIFEPGFSTLDSVNEIAGRGVGMNVVNNELRRVRGKVLIDSTKDKGTTFTIVIPNNLAVIDGTIVKIINEQYIIPTSYIKEFLVLDKEHFISMKGKVSAIRLREQIIPLISLQDIFSDNILESYESKHCVILEIDNREIAVVVDEIVGKREIVSKSIEDKIGEMPCFIGASILGDGNVALIIDVDYLFNSKRIM